MAAAVNDREESAMRIVRWVSIMACLATAACPSAVGGGDAAAVVNDVARRDLLPDDVPRRDDVADAAPDASRGLEDCENGVDDNGDGEVDHDDDDCVEGAVYAFFRGVAPREMLRAGGAYAFAFVVEANVYSPRLEEEFVLHASVSSPGWRVTLDRERVTLAAFGYDSGRTPPPLAMRTVLVTATVTADGSSAAATLRVEARHREPRIRSVQHGIPLQLGTPPPAELALFYTGPPPLVDGPLPVPRAQLASATGRSIIVRLLNPASDERRFVVSCHVAPDVADPAEWSPLAATPAVLPVVTVSARPSGALYAAAPVACSIAGPQPPRPAPSVGVTGDVVVRAQRVGSDRQPVAGVPLEEIHVPFVVVE
jgi:hypothetical protein